MEKVYEYEVVFHVTMTKPMEELIPDPDDRNLANIANASEECVMEIKEFHPNS